MVGTRRPPIDEDDVEIAAPPRNHQTGDAPTAAQIDQRARDVSEGVHEPVAVGDDVTNRRGTEHAQALRRGQRLGEGSVRIRRRTGPFRSRRTDDDPAVGIFAFRAADHPIDGCQRVVDDLAIR